MTALPFAMLMALLAQAPAAPAFRYERAIAVASPGPQRLAIDATVVAGGAPFTVTRRGGFPQRLVAEGGLSDLRLYGSDGREVPYLLVYAPADDPQGARAPGAAPPPLIVPLRFEKRPSEPGRSRYHVMLPGSRLPLVALRLDAGGTYLFRSVTVTEPRLSAWQATPAAIGDGLLVRDRSSGTTLRVPIQQPSQAELDLVVEDGDNPPLDLRSVAAEFAELPWIYFEARGPLVARYGDTTLARPLYDLEAARASLQIETIPEARWASAPAEPTPEAPRPRVDAAALTGGPIDVSAFRYARAIAAGGSELVALPLDAAVLAHSAGPAREFADVRIVDGSGRQVPRLVERRPEPLVIPLVAERAAAVAVELRPKAGRQRSIYHITLPYAALPDARIALSTTTPVFERRVAIGFERPVDRAHRDPWFMSIADAEWMRAQGAPAVLTLPLSTAAPDATQLTLVVDEGDNGALPISSVQLLLPAYRLRFVRPSSAAHLVYGNVTVDPPRYDLALLAPTVLTVAVTDVSMAGETGGTPATVTESFISPRIFWIVLAVAVVALLGVLIALLRQKT